MATYPNFLEDPHTGLVDEGREQTHCKHCIRHGEIQQPLRRVLFREDEDVLSLNDHMIKEPCTICAMANGGWWGWNNVVSDQAEINTVEQRIESNGAFPGRDGISDAISGHSVISTSNPINHLASDYQVILGFVQYALFNHKKWSEILFSSSEPDMESYKNMSEDINWYWWKIIPSGLVLPKRFHTILCQMIVDYQFDTCLLYTSPSPRD